jgi:hypothetical protein
MNRRLYNNHSFVETAIYRVFVMIYLVVDLAMPTAGYAYAFVDLAMPTAGYAYAFVDSVFAFVDSVFAFVISAYP